MKQFFAFALLTLAALAINAQTPVLGTAHTIDLSWTAPPTQAGLTLTGYTLTITPPAGVTGTTTITNCTAGQTTNCIAGATATTLAWSPVPGPLYEGVWGFSLVANYTNSAGTTVVSPPATASVAYVPAVTIGAAPGGVTVTFQ